MKILITGGAGFIGSHLIDSILKGYPDDKVVCLDNLSTGKLSNISNNFGNPRFDLEIIDILDINRLDKVVQGTDIIYNLMASKKTICNRDPVLDCRINAGGTLGLLIIAEKHNVRKFIHVSTGSVFGEVPGIITEETPFRPVSYYGISKLAGERYASYFRDFYKMDITIIRPFHVYGPRQESGPDGGVVAIFARRIKEDKHIFIYGSGDQVRSFTHISDLVRALDIVRFKKFGVYNVASGVKISLRDLVSAICDVLGKPPPDIVYHDIQEGDIFNFDVDNKKVRQDLDIKFIKDLRKGLKYLKYE